MEHFHQLQGVEGVPCSYLMQEQVIYEGKLFSRIKQTPDEQMIQDYPIVAKTYWTNRAHWTNDGIPPLEFYTPKATEDNVMCYHELCHIVEGTEAQVYVDEFKLKADFRATWPKRYNNYLGKVAQNTLAAELENKIMGLKYAGRCKGFTFATYVERHKTTYQAMLAVAK